MPYYCSVKKYIAQFLDYLKYERKFSPHTIVSYSNDLEEFATYFHQDNPSSIEKIHIREYITHLSKNQLQTKTIRRKISSIRSFFKYLIKENICTQNPCTGIILPKIKKQIPEFLNTDALQVYFTQQNDTNDFESIRNNLIIDILYQTGIRRSELMQLQWKDIDLYNLTLKVIGKRNKERIIPFSHTLKNNLNKYLLVLKEKQIMNEYLLVDEKGKHLSSFQIYYIVKKELSKITTQNKKHPHVLRHTFATHMLNNGADINAVKELLGHANLKATEIYTHNNIEQLKKIYKQAHPRSGE